MAMETRHDPVLSRITSRIRKNAKGNCSRAERPYKETRHKLTIEHRVFYNGDLIIPPETQRKLVIKSVHDDIHCGVAATQKRIKLEAYRLGYSRYVKKYIIIIIIISCHQHRSPWPSSATRLYRPSFPVSLHGYILYQHRTVVYRFYQVVLTLLVHLKGSTGVCSLWVRPHFSSSVLHVWFV